MPLSQTHQKYTGGFIEDQRTFFDELITHDWESYNIPTWENVRREEIRQILTITGDRLDSVLDIGCGSGYHDLVLAQSDGIKSVIGIDYSSKSVEQAEKHFPHKKITRRVVDIFDSAAMAPFNKKFDLVVSFQVIEHLKFAKEFFEILARAVKESGFVAVVTPNWNRLENRLRSSLGLKYGFCDPLHFKEYTIDDLIQLGRDAHLKFAGAFGHTFHVSVKGFSLLNSSQCVSYRRFPSLVKLANVIGVVFQSTNVNKSS